MIRIALVCSLAALCVGCFDGSPLNGTLTCATTGPQCPAGYLCTSDNTCWRMGQAASGSSDAAVSHDAATGDVDLSSDAALSDAGSASDAGSTSDGAVCTPTVTVCPASVGCGKIDDGCGGTVDCGACLLAAIDPSIAAVGATVTLEGSFGSDATVVFPGGISQAATVLGPHRATVVVPPGATDGGLTVTTATSTLGPLPFRSPAFALGLGRFNANYEQADGARLMPALTTTRVGARSVVAGNMIYVSGGYGQQSAMSSVERATINADGSLSPFTIASFFGTARANHTSVVIGHYFYLIGGSSGSDLDSVERATINADGSLTSFSALTDVALVNARSGHTCEIIGNYLYVIGGSHNSVERATIAPDGTIAQFATVSNVVPTTSRILHTSALLGDWLYIIGGFNNDNGINSVERAAVAPDGSLGSFSIVPDVTLATGRYGHSGAVLGDSVYVLGGTENNVSGPILGSVERATIAADGSLSTFAAVSGVNFATPRCEHSSVIAGNSLYVIGGFTSSSGGATTSIERATLDASGALSSFTSAANLNTARAYHSSTVVGDSIYVIGGINNGNVVQDLEQATVNSDGSLASFSIPPGAGLGTPRAWHTSAVLGDHLYVVGGVVGNSGGALGSLEQATIDGDTLSSFQPANVALINPRYGHSSVVVGSYLYVIGGASNAPIERALINSDNTLSSFQPANVALVTARIAHTSVVIGNYLYVIGGSSTSGHLNTIEQATINSDNTLSSFQTLGVTLTTPRFGHASVVVSDYLYVIGGYSSDALSSVERSAINADGTLAGFETVDASALGTKRWYPTSTVAGHVLHVIGGMSGAGDVFNSVEQASLE